MSALLPKADKQQTVSIVRFMPKADIRIAADLLDHLIGEREQFVRDVEAIDRQTPR
jgi:hypothetical protein